MPETASPIGTRLAPHLPFLRRYARALTGGQQQGDKLVRTLLEILVAEPDLLRRDADLRVEIYRLFHAVGQQRISDLEHKPGAGAVVGEALLSQLESHRREAMLLTAVEGFDVDDVATILDRSVADVRSDIAHARSVITEGMRSRVLIIEDEPIILMHLESIVEDMGHEVAGTAITRDEAVARAQEGGIDLVLADIRLADDSSGIDAVNDICSQINLPVVFITAFPERLLTGKRPEPTYLITKPFETATVEATIGQALLMHWPASATI